MFGIFLTNLTILFPEGKFDPKSLIGQYANLVRDEPGAEETGGE